VNFDYLEAWDGWTDRDETFLKQTFVRSILGLTITYDTNHQSHQPYD
jgi:hypothetical protein